MRLEGFNPATGELIESFEEISDSDLVLVLRDGKYGVIQHHMDTRLGRHFGVDFGNPIW